MVGLFLAGLIPSIYLFVDRILPEPQLSSALLLITSFLLYSTVVLLTYTLLQGRALKMLYRKIESILSEELSAQKNAVKSGKFEEVFGLCEEPQAPLRSRPEVD